MPGRARVFARCSTLAILRAQISIKPRKAGLRDSSAISALRSRLADSTTSRLFAIALAAVALFFASDAPLRSHPGGSSSTPRNNDQPGTRPESKFDSPVGFSTRPPARNTKKCNGFLRWLFAQRDRIPEATCVLRRTRRGSPSGSSCESVCARALALAASTCHPRQWARGSRRALVWRGFE